jgi:hypothetical protein
MMVLPNIRRVVDAIQGMMPLKNHLEKISAG